MATALIVRLIAGYVLAVVLVLAFVSIITACGARDRGVVSTKIHVSEGTPNSETGGVHHEQWFVHCRNVRTGIIHDVSVTRDEYERTAVGDTCDVNRR